MEEEDLRIRRHPVLGDMPGARTVTIWVEGRPLSALEGEPLVSALYAVGLRRLGLSPRGGEPRGAFCMMGRCLDCLVFVEGRGSVRACRTPVEEGMRVWRYEGTRPLHQDTLSAASSRGDEGAGGGGS